MGTSSPDKSLCLPLGSKCWCKMGSYSVLLIQICPSSGKLAPPSSRVPAETWCPWDAGRRTASSLQGYTHASYNLENIQPGMCLPAQTKALLPVSLLRPGGRLPFFWLWALPNGTV
jgi:hypothetical protein